MRPIDSRRLASVIAIFAITAPIPACTNRVNTGPASDAASPTTATPSVGETPPTSEATSTIAPKESPTTQAPEQQNTSLTAAIDNLNKILDTIEPDTQYVLEDSLCPLFPDLVPDIINYPPLEIERQRWVVSHVGESTLQRFDQRANGPAVMFGCYDGNYHIATVNYFPEWNIRDALDNSDVTLPQYFPKGATFPHEPYYDFEFFGSIQDSWGKFIAASDHLVIAVEGHYQPVIDWLNQDWTQHLANLFSEQSIWIYLQQADKEAL